jgi:hypothetical protein
VEAPSRHLLGASSLYGGSAPHSLRPNPSRRSWITSAVCRSRMMADERAAEVRTIKAAPSGVLGEKKCGARAEPPLRLGPVGPNDIIFATVGSKGVFAFYEPDGTHCALHVVV